MKQTVIFCESYVQIDNTLAVVEDTSADNRITLVIINHDELVKFFKLVRVKLCLENIYLVQIKTYSDPVILRSLFKPIRLLSRIVLQRIYLNGLYERYFRQYQNADIHFFCRCFGNYTFFFLQRLAKRNNITYTADIVYHDRPIVTNPTSIREAVMLFRDKLTFGLSSQRGRSDFATFDTVSVIPESFIQRHTARRIENEERCRLIRESKIKSRLGLSDSYDVVYFDSPLLEYDFISNPEVLRKQLNGIFNMIREFFREDKIALKFHPGEDGNKKLIDFGGMNIIEDFIPGEFLCGGNVKLYMGIMSNALANIPEEDWKIISIIDLISFKSEEYRSKCKNMLLGRAKGEILFPSRREELGAILKTIR